MDILSISIVTEGIEEWGESSHYTPLGEKPEYTEPPMRYEYFKVYHTRWGTETRYLIEREPCKLEEISEEYFYKLQRNPV